MRSIWLTPIPLIITSIIVMGALYLWDRSTAPYSEVDAYSATAGEQTYTNKTYGYSVDYPSSLESEELAPEYTQIGQDQSGTFVAQADMAILYASAQGALPSFADFVRLAAQLACNVDGSSSPVTCTTVATSTPFTTGSGISGNELYFNSNAGERGPFIAFDLTNNVPNVSYAVLLMYPPQQVAASNADTSLLEGIASSLQVAFK